MFTLNYRAMVPAEFWTRTVVHNFVSVAQQFYLFSNISIEQ